MLAEPGSLETCAVARQGTSVYVDGVGVSLFTVGARSVEVDRLK